MKNLSTTVFCLLQRGILFAGVAFGLLAGGCGGGVSAPPPPEAPTLTVLPGTATMYTGLPTTFSVSGGTGSYIATSSDQRVLPISGPLEGRFLTVVPGPVLVDTSVTLTVRDTGAAAPVSVAVTVRPNTVTNEVTVQASPTQDASCTPALCSGTEAEVRFTITQGGFPVAGRLVQFEALTGSFGLVGFGGVSGRVVTSATDAGGVARARLRVDALAPSQTALLRATDLVGGAFREVGFAIAYYTGSVPAFFAIPTSVTFSGPFKGRCADAIANEATVAVYGGVPPYSVVSGSSAFTVTPTGLFVLNRFSNALRVRVSGNGECARDVPVVIEDALGTTLRVNLSNIEGVVDQPPGAITLAPAALTLSCSFTVANPTTPPTSTQVTLTSSISVSGGSAPFYAATSHPRVQLSAVGRVVSVSRLAGDPSGELYPALAEIVVSDGSRSATAVASVPINCP